MGIEIRGIKQDDFQSIYDLYAGNKTIDLHKWLYAYPNSEDYNGYAAIMDGKICGLIGFTKTEYNVGGEIAIGVVPHSFLVDEKQRGIAGLKLLNKVFSDADFYMYVDGTEMSQKIFQVMRFTTIGSAVGASKSYRLNINFNKKTLNGYANMFNDNWRIIKSWFAAKAIDFEVVEGEASEQELVSGVFNNMLSHRHLNWLRKNPLYQVKVLTVKLDTGKSETFVCCLHKNKSKMKCQITHHSPLLYDNSTLIRILGSLERYLVKNYQIYHTNVLVSSDRLRSTFSALGYHFEKKQRPIGLKSKNGFEEKIKNLENVLCFSECDESTRNI